MKILAIKNPKFYSLGLSEGLLHKGFFPNLAVWMSINHYNRLWKLSWEVWLKKNKERKEKTMKYSGIFFFLQVQCDPNPTLFPCIRMPLLETTELKLESKLWFHATIIGMLRFNMSAAQGWTLVVLCQNPATVKLKAFTMQVWLRCWISVLLPYSGCFWMAAFILKAQLHGYLEFPASSVLQGGKELLGTLRWGVFDVSSTHQSSFVCASLWICCPKKTWHFSGHFCSCCLPQAQGLYFAAEAKSLTSIFLHSLDFGQ